MNHIHRLQVELAQAQATIASYKAQLAQFSAFLCGPKFTGVESDGSRKDWISTGDVLRALRDISAQADEAGESHAANVRWEKFAARNKLRKPEQWEEIDRVKIVDPDGWRDGTDWNKPICREEWERRRDESTTCPMDRFNAQFEEWRGDSRSAGVGCD